MASIYELTGDWLTVYNMVDDDIDEQVWFDTMEAIEGEIEYKADNIAKVIKELNAEADAIKAEADRLAARAKARSNRAEWLKKNLEASMKATGKTKFKTELFSFGIQKNPSSIAFTDDFDINAVPAEYLKFKDPEVNKTELKKAIESGLEVKGAYINQTEGLRIR